MNPTRQCVRCERTADAHGTRRREGSLSHPEKLRQLLDSGRVEPRTGRRRGDERSEGEERAEDYGAGKTVSGQVDGTGI